MSSVVVYGLVFSLIAILFFSVLFAYERKRGIRFGDRARTHADFYLLKVTHSLHLALRFMGKDLLRQTFHYAFHTVLFLILKFTKQCENSLRNAIRSNKTIARNAERESATLTKLEEIALHKVASALTEEEKKEHKDRILSGT